MKTHYRRVRDGQAFCGLPVFEAHLTGVKSDVTCKICLHYLKPHVVHSMWLKALGKVPGKTSHETAQSPASIAGLLTEYVEESERVQRLKAALQSIADACECTCGECPCQRIARKALEALK